jgi:MFS transporter, DHA1 family, inner membrane transport protein
MNARSPRPPPAAGEKIFRRAAFGLAFATAVVVTTEFIVVGLLPMMARDLAVSIADGGQLVSWFAIASAIGGPLVTMACGGIAPRRVFVAVLLVFAAGNLVTALVPTYVILVAVRVVEGAALPVLVSIGSVAIAPLAGPGQSARGVAIIYLGVVIGLVLAVPVGVMIAEAAGWPATFVVLAALSLAAALVCTFFPDTEATENLALSSQAAILRRPVLLAHLLLSAVIAIALFAPYTYLAAFLARVIGLTGDRVGLALMWFGIAGLVGNSIAGRVVERGPTTTTIGLAAFLIVVTAAIPLIRESPVLLLPVLAIWGAVHAATFLVSQVRVMRVAKDAQAFAAALNISAGNAGIAAGATVGGWFVRHQGLDAIGHGGLAFAVSALTLALIIARTTDAASARSSRIPVNDPAQG